MLSIEIEQLLKEENSDMAMIRMAEEIENIQNKLNHMEVKK